MHLLEVVLSLLILHIYSVRLIKRQDTSLLPKHYGLSIRSQIGECLKSCFIIATSVSTVHAETNPKSIEILKSTIFETDLGIKYISVKKGSGPYPHIGDFVAIDYIAFLNNGTIFDSTEARGHKYLSFTLGKSQVIEGLENVISYMQPGGEVTCTIPAQLAFGKKGICVANTTDCLVPPNETVKYVVKLKNVGVSYN